MNSNIRARLGHKIKQFVLGNELLRGVGRKLLNLFLPSGPRLVTIVDGPVKGFYIVSDLKQQKGYWLGTYEVQIVDLLSKYVKSGSSVYDIGGHLGYFSLILAKLVGETGHVITFEPNPANAKAIRKMILANKLEERIDLIEAAVADKKGHAKFVISNNSSAQGKLLTTSKLDNHNYTVEVVRLDDLSDQIPPPAFIKIDVEGAEGLVLAGMSQIIKTSRPIFLIEIHGKEAGQAVWKHLSSACYSLWQVENEKAVCGSSDMVGGHVIALPGELPDGS